MPRVFRFKDLTIDHLYPRSRFPELKEKFNLDFGLNSWLNLVTSCKKCNSKKGDRTLTELNWPQVNPEIPLSHLEINWTEVMEGVENVSSLDISALWK
jgi:5-methylcytosine-specific restriction endonuclease McrA